MALVNDYMLVVRGLHQMLEPYADRIEVVELDVRSGVMQPVDIALYDTFSQTQVDADDVDRRAARPGCHAGRGLHLEHAADADRQGAGEGRTRLPVQVAAGLRARQRPRAHPWRESVVAPKQDIDIAPTEVAGGEWPGRGHGLSPRQAEVLALVTQGLTNEEISKRAYLSINTVKSYLRQAYRVIDVSSRSQAILWGLDHGLGLQERESEAD